MCRAKATMSKRGEKKERKRARKKIESDQGKNAPQ